MGDNLTIKANYAFEGVKDGDTVYGDGYSFGAIYALDMGLAFGAGYSEQDVVDDNTQKQAFAAVSYTHGNFYVAALYQDARNATDNVYGETARESHGYEVAGAYTMGKTVFTATYNKLEDSNESGDYADLQDSIAIDATHYFNRNFRAYASYKFNLLDTPNNAGLTKSDTSDEFVLGARYDF